jgi:hypothetical protein
MRSIERLGKTEIEHLDLAVASDLNIRGLEVAVHDAPPVGGLKRLGDLPRDPNRVANRQRAALEAFGQRRPRNVLQHEEACFTRLLETVNGGNVRMVQRRERACLSLQSLPSVVLQQLGTHDLQRDGPIQLRVDGLVDDTHTADSNTLLDPIVTERGVRIERGH